MQASYLKLSKEKLKENGGKAWELLSPCRICPRECGTNRANDEKTGFCRMGRKPKIASYNSHFGEERPLVGMFGSGTIFFSSCNLACIYCQNFDISQLRSGAEIKIEHLAEIMLSHQKRGCHNINLVSPSIWVPQILKALLIAADKGLKIPLVYNTGGYDSVETLKILDGIVDIYMPDIKYSDSKLALKYSAALGYPTERSYPAQRGDNHAQRDYWDIAQRAVLEMHHQVGDLNLNEKGIAQRGLLIRHLVLPNDIAGTEKVMEFIASLSKNTYVNIMDQYYPTFKAHLYPEINRRITGEEFKNAIEIAKEKELWRFDHLFQQAF